MQARRKAGPIGTYVMFDAALAPEWGLYLRDGEWWYDDGMSRYTVAQNFIIHLDNDGQYAGQTHPKYFEDEYEVLGEEPVPPGKMRLVDAPLQYPDPLVW